MNEEVTPARRSVAVRHLIRGASYEWRVRSGQGPGNTLATSSRTVPSRHGSVPFSSYDSGTQCRPFSDSASGRSTSSRPEASQICTAPGAAPHAVLHHSPRGRLQALPARCVLREALDRAVGASFSPPWLGTVHTGGGGAALFGISLEAELDVEPAEASQICTAPGAPSGSQAALDPRARPRHPLPARCVLREAINGLDSPGASIRVGSSCLGWIPDRIGDSRSHRGGPSGHGAFFSTPAAQAIGIGTARRLLLRPVGRPRWRPLFPHMPPASHLGRGEAFDRYQKAPRRATRSNAIPPYLSHSGKALPFPPRLARRPFPTLPPACPPAVARRSTATGYTNGAAPGTCLLDRTRPHPHYPAWRGAFPLGLSARGEGSPRDFTVTQSKE